MKDWYAELFEDGQLFARIDCDNEDHAKKAVHDWQKGLPGRRSGQLGPTKQERVPDPTVP